MRFTKVLVTGAAGFIGSNFVHHIMDAHDDVHVIGLDKIGYAGNLRNLDGLSRPDDFTFVEADVTDQDRVDEIVRDVDAVVHFAAESMVDRSVIDGRPFVLSNVLGTYTLLTAVRRVGSVQKVLYISTPEVYGERTGAAAVETAVFDPRNIYAASKAGAEMQVAAFRHSFGLPIVITRGSNALGPRQHLEKVLPLWITSAIDDRPLLMYGDGSAVRDWIHVQDMNAANDLVLHNAEPGESYNIVSGSEHSLRELAEGVLRRLGKPDTLIEQVGERPAHDRRYHMSIDKLRSLGWAPQYSFDSMLDETVAWYVDNESVWRPVQASEDYINYLEANFAAKRASRS